jgi:hypothetical protein
MTGNSCTTQRPHRKALHERVHFIHTLKVLSAFAVDFQWYLSCTHAVKIVRLTE